MSCVLPASGAGFDVDQSLASSTLKTIADFRRGHRMSSLSPPGSAPLSESGFHASASEADLSELRKQIDDAVRFLEENSNELKPLVGYRGVEHVWLDFGIEERDVPAQKERFPPRLLSLLGEIGIWLVFTLYLCQDAPSL